MSIFAPISLAAFAAAGFAGLWPGFAPPLLLVAVLWLPGHVAVGLAGRVPRALPMQGPGRLAVDAVVGLTFVEIAIACLFVRGSGLSSAPILLASLYAVVAVWGVVWARRPSVNAVAPVDGKRGIVLEWFAAALCLAVLLPPVLSYAGGKVDDWWDLAFVRAFVERPVLSFHEPILGSGLVHPRFAWNGWLLLQALICKVSGADVVLFQQAWIPVVVCLLSVAATAALAESVFWRGRGLERIATLGFLPLWLYGTEAIPFFSRLHQDKFVAALVAAPTLLALLARFLRRPSIGAWLLVAAASAVTCSIHSIVFGFSVVVGTLIAWVWPANEIDADAAALRVRAVVLAALLLPSAYPLWQWFALSSLFSGQGISLAAPGNPVVRAHLWLDRLWWPNSSFYVVRPSAVFGFVAVLALPGLGRAWRQRNEAGARLLLAGSLLPCAVAFVPGIAGLAGRVFVPWMMYRFLWLVPVALLGGSTVAWGWADSSRRRWVIRAVVVIAACGLVLPVARDRYRRGMAERPFVRPSYPTATTLHAYRFLATAPLPGAVLAPIGFSELVPAMTGHPVVAISERGTVVFSPTETRAYARLRDRAEFFASGTDPRRRVQLAEKYGVSYAVFRRRYITRGSQSRLLRRGSAEGFLARTTTTRSALWSASRRDLRRGLPSLWPIVFANDDFWIVACPPLRPASTGEDSDSLGSRVPWAPLTGAASGSAVARSAWLRVFALDATDREHTDAGLQVLAGLVAYPHGRVTAQPLPLAAGNADEPIWSSGGASWDDAPSSVELTVELGRRCSVGAVEVVPFLRRYRREVFEISVDGVTRRERASDGKTITLRLEMRPRSRVRIHVRSLLGRAFGLSDVRVLGSETSCDEPASRDSVPAGLRKQVRERTSIRGLLRLAALYPDNASPAIALARKRSDHGAFDDARALLEQAVRRDPGLAAAWVELGLARDGSGGPGEASAPFRQAVRVDSHNAWARGCLAWAEYRRGRPIQALYQARRAAALDGRYADAYTIRGMAERSLGLAGWATRSFRTALRLDPARDWPYLEMASLLVAEQRGLEAERMLKRYLKINPAGARAKARLLALEKARGELPAAGSP